MNRFNNKNHHKFGKVKSTTRLVKLDRVELEHNKKICKENCKHDKTNYTNHIYNNDSVELRSSSDSSELESETTSTEYNMQGSISD